MHKEIEDYIPTHDFLIVQREEQVTRMGILYLDENRIDQSPWVKVLKVGPGRKLSNGKRSPMPVKPGDRCYVQPSIGYRLYPAEGFGSPTIIQMSAVEAIDNGEE